MTSPRTITACIACGKPIRGNQRQAWLTITPAAGRRVWDGSCKRAGAAHEKCLPEWCWTVPAAPVVTMTDLGFGRDEETVND